jgi:Mitochondrial carrier protein
MNAEQKYSHVSRNTLASVVAGASGVLIGFPFDVLKTRMY